MKTTLPLLAAALCLATPLSAQEPEAPDDRVPSAEEAPVRQFFEQIGQARYRVDLAALESFRPGFAFWKHVFSIPDGQVVYGSATDGRLLATFPRSGEWSSSASWTDPELANLVDGIPLERRVSDRRDQVAELLEPHVGPVVHNASRGDFLLPNLDRYGSFLGEWGAIYERFGIPAEIGLAQAFLESGLDGRIRSGAGALGFCQWMPRNWRRLKQLTPHVIEGYNQTTQAAYCAAHLTILATKYGSLIPALSEHHAGVGNVGKVLANGVWLGEQDVRRQYLIAADFSRELRLLPGRRFRPIVGSFGLSSYLYTEMVFGNAFSARERMESIPQQKIYAMRAKRSFSLDELQRVTGLSASALRRFNPALVRQLPRSATLYLPEPVEAIGSDVTFWHRPAPDAFAEVLNDFVRLDVPAEEWEAASFEPVLQEFRRRFRASGSEEGLVMEAVLGYVIETIPTIRRVMSEYRSSSRVAELLEEGMRLRTGALVDTDQND